MSVQNEQNDVMQGVSSSPIRKNANYRIIPLDITSLNKSYAGGTHGNVTVTATLTNPVSNFLQLQLNVTMKLQIKTDTSKSDTDETAWSDANDMDVPDVIELEPTSSTANPKLFPNTGGNHDWDVSWVFPSPLGNGPGTHPKYRVQLYVRWFAELDDGPTATSVWSPAA